MFEQRWVPQNGRQVLWITNPATGTRLAVCPEHGASLLGLDLAGQTVIATPVSFPDDYRFEGAVLSPFPNKIRDGRYAFDGREFALPKNAFQGKHAAHGLLYNQKFGWEDSQLLPERAAVTLGHTYSGEQPGYPFRYHLSVCYVLEDAALRVTFTTTNLADCQTPYGLGFHPYFTLPPGSGDTKLVVPPCELLEFDAENLPSGSSKVFSNYAAGGSLDGLSFNHCFKIPKGQPDFRITVEPGRGAAPVTIEFIEGESAFSYFQLFKTQQGSEIAVEPMTCAPDAFNNGIGLMLLASGQVVSSSVSVSVGKELELGN